jgi:opacity protein-like surface antigen
MRPKSLCRVHTDIPLLIIAILVLLVQPSGNALAEDLLGLYLGGAIGQSHVEAKVTACSCDIFPEIGTENIDKEQLAFKAMLGMRPISWVGAEIEYIDFGKSTGEAFGYPANASLKGVAAFGVLYLPVPIVDVYVKAGVARLQGSMNYSYCSPCACDLCLNSVQQNRTNTSGAAAVGTQYKFGSWAVRAEYERFNAAGGNPSMVSAGITWTFF